MSDLRHEVENGEERDQQRTAPQQPVKQVVTVEAEGDRTGAGSSYPDDWTIAALSHASVLLTLLLAFAGGVGAIVGLVVPLVIYLSYRERSRFVAFQALQALVYQGAGVLIYLVLVIVLALVVTVSWIVSGLLSAVIIGFLLMPIALLLTLLMVIALLAAPLAWVAYGLYAAYEVYQGNRFRYWLVGEWVEREVTL